MISKNPGGVARLDIIPTQHDNNTDQSVGIMLKQSRSEETRQQIMSAAIALFCRSGYDATGVASICTQAGVSKGAFYHHFPSKKELFLAIMDDWLNELNLQLQSMRSSEKNVPETIMGMAQAIGLVFNVASGQLPMFMEFMVQASHDESIWEASIAPYQQYQRQFAQLIEEGVKEGSFKPGTDIESAAWALIALAVGLLLQGIVLPHATDWEKVTREGVARILESMQLRSAA